MDVQVKLWLQGGHVWEFCCDEDDPMIFGLVSALPGADLGGNLPEDGLIQLETRTGERLFLARSSLVSVDVVPIVDELQFLNANRLASPATGPAQGVLTPSPFAMAANALPSEIHRALVGHALAQDASMSSAAAGRTVRTQARAACGASRKRAALPPVQELCRVRPSRTCRI